MKIENIHNEEKIFWKNCTRGKGEFFVTENLSIGTKSSESSTSQKNEFISYSFQ